MKKYFDFSANRLNFRHFHPRSILSPTLSLSVIQLNAKNCAAADGDGQDRMQCNDRSGGGGIGVEWDAFPIAASGLQDLYCSSSYRRRLIKRLTQGISQFHNR